MTESSWQRCTVGHDVCTPDIHNYLVDRVEVVGLFSMLRECTVPLMQTLKLKWAWASQVDADLENKAEHVPSRCRGIYAAVAEGNSELH
jgi:hypothetical protein